MTLQMTASSWLINSSSSCPMSHSSEASDLLVFCMASVPGEMLDVLTKNTHWDTDAIFLQ